MQIVLPSKPDVIAAPDPVQSRHCCYCSSDVDICSGAAIFGEIGSQVLKTVDLFWPYPVDISFAIAVASFTFVSGWSP